MKMYNNESTYDLGTQSYNFEYEYKLKIFIFYYEYKSLKLFVADPFSRIRFLKNRHLLLGWKTFLIEVSVWVLVDKIYRSRLRFLFRLLKIKVYISVSAEIFFF